MKHQRPIPKYNKHPNYSQYLLVIKAYQHQLVIHNTTYSQIQSSQICPVSKSSNDAGWEPVSHMAKLCPCKTKETLEYLQVHCPRLCCYHTLSHIY